MLASGERRLRQLFRRSAATRLPVDVLRRIDPQLLSLQNINGQKDYEALLQYLNIDRKPTEHS